MRIPSLAFPAALVAAVCLTACAAEDTSVPVRPGNPETGSPFWNGRSPRFIYAPAFDFKRLKCTDRYVFRVYDTADRVHVFTNAVPWAPLSPVWNELPVGRCLVVCEGLTKEGVVTGLSGTRAFWKAGAFAGRDGVRARSYADAAKAAYLYALDCPSSRYFLEKGRPDPSYEINGFPSKMHASVICGMINLSTLEPARKDEAIRLANLSAEFLLKTSESADAPFAHWPQTYWTKDGQQCNRAGLADTIMTLYPADVGEAYVRLAAATGEKKWLAAAERIAETYLRVRAADGSWPLVVVKKTGVAQVPNKAVPIDLVDFFEALYAATGKSVYRETSDSCFKAVETGPCRDWDWEAQFEDQKPAEKYYNLTKHNACNTLLYVLRRFPGDAGRLALATDLIRFSEDQFVFWDDPCLPDGSSMYFHGGAGWGGIRPGDWKVPLVCEQYGCYTPVDASAAKLIRSYLALYRATKDGLYLEKARALGDRMTTIQCDDGFIATWWNKSHDFGWMNCNLASADALMELSNVAD